jgi:hypothetical protein
MSSAQGYSCLPASATNRQVTLPPTTSCLRAQPWESCHLAGFRCRLSRGAWLFPRCCGIYFPSGCGSDWMAIPAWAGLLRSAMVAMVQRLDACSFFGQPQLSVTTFSVLVLKVHRNRFSCHGPSVAELSLSKLSNFGHRRLVSHLPSLATQITRQVTRWFGKNIKDREAGWRRDLLACPDFPTPRLSSVRIHSLEDSNQQWRTCLVL